ncbi:hypothetical protein SAMN04487901_10693 [Prevotella communis]|uniref:Uncharacterized protein n=1 Tax=Prevotella communis TaxID=2913614 RepID=A0A1H0KTF8_9BACT|nr:hypothetical protein SAMN04487901_10693 [Prevotella communis]SDO59219.1 hypothetical protein SAMN04487900_13012 [Prevotella communis]
MDYANITNTLQSFVVTTFYYIIRLLLSPLLLCHIRAIRIRFDQILLDFLRPFGSKRAKLERCPIGHSIQFRTFRSL